MKPILLGPNQPVRFYRGGPAIARFRGLLPDDGSVPEDWVASTTVIFGDGSRGLTVLPDGRLLRDAIAGRARGLPRPRARTPFRRRSGAARQAARRGRAPARARAPRPPLRARPARRAAREGGGVADRRRRRRARPHPCRFPRGRRPGRAGRVGLGPGRRRDAGRAQRAPGRAGRLHLRAGGHAALDRRGRAHGRGAGALRPRRAARMVEVRARRGRGRDDGARLRRRPRVRPAHGRRPRRARGVDATERRGAGDAPRCAAGRACGGGALLPCGVAASRPERRARAGLFRPRRRLRRGAARDGRRRAPAREGRARCSCRTRRARASSAERSKRCAACRRASRRRTGDGDRPAGTAAGRGVQRLHARAGAGTAPEGVLLLQPLLALRLPDPARRLLLALDAAGDVPHLAEPLADRAHHLRGRPARDRRDVRDHHRRHRPLDRRHPLLLRRRGRRGDARALRDERADARRPLPARGPRDPGRGRRVRARRRRSGGS